MKQLQQSYNNGRTTLESVPLHQPGRCEAQVKTVTSLVSAGTEKMVVDIAHKSALGKARARPDLAKQVWDRVRQEGLWTTVEKVRTKLDTPIPLGSSASGVVTSSGAQAGVQIGSRVACGGAGVANHAEYNVVPRNLMVPIPESVSFEDASFVTIGAIALQGVRQVAPTIGERVAVIGLGLIGQLTVQILKANGCDVLGTDIDPWKLDLAQELGADEAVLPDAFVSAGKQLSRNRGVDAVIITAATQSEQPINDAGHVSRRKGRVVSVGITNLNVPRDLYYYKELELRLSHAYGPGRHDPLYEQKGIDYPFEYVRWTEQRNFEAFLRLVETGKVTPSRLVTHRFVFEDAVSAYEMLTSGEEKYLGILLTYSTAVEESPPRATITVAQSPTRQKDVALGVIGTGGFAKSVLLPRIKKRSDITRSVAASRSGLSARHAAEKYQFNTASTDYEEVIKSDEVDAVVVATRHNSHAWLVRDGIAHGKHIFVEKPLAIDEDGLRQVIEEYHGQAVLQVGFNRRFSSHAAKAKGAIGGRQALLSYRVNAGEAPADSWLHDPEIGGGRIIGEVCHFIDFASFVLDADPLRVSTTRVSQRNTHDDVSITLTYDNGSVATILYLAKGNARLPKEYIEIFAEDTAASVDNFQKTTIHTGPKKSIHKTRGQDKGFDQELDAFFYSIRAGESAIPFESLVGTTRATFAAVESITTGQIMSL